MKAPVITREMHRPTANLPSVFDRLHHFGWLVFVVAVSDRLNFRVVRQARLKSVLDLIMRVVLFAVIRSLLENNHAKSCSSQLFRHDAARGPGANNEKIDGLGGLESRDSHFVTAS